MTRKEFMAARAKADFEKTHGVTKCPSAQAAGSQKLMPYTVIPRGTRRGHRDAFVAEIVNGVATAGRKDRRIS